MARFSVKEVAFAIVCGLPLCLWTIVDMCRCHGGHRQPRDSKEKKQFELRQRMAPRPKIARTLGRSLTISDPKEATSSATSTSPVGLKTLDQTKSRLLGRLPFEIREMIYEAVLGDSAMHIVLKDRKIGHIKCPKRSVLDCPLGYTGRSLSRECCWGNFDSKGIWIQRRKKGGKSREGSIVPFLQSCRQIYSEAIDILYTANTFSISDLDCLRHFSLTPRFPLIRTLDIEWCMTWPIYDPVSQALFRRTLTLYPPHDEATWEDTWRIVSQMPQLHFLRVNLLYFDGLRHPESEEKMLRPLFKIRRPETFEVHVSGQSFTSESLLQENGVAVWGRGSVLERDWRDEEGGLPFVLISPVVGASVRSTGENEDD